MDSRMGQPKGCYKTCEKYDKKVKLKCPECLKKEQQNLMKAESIYLGMVYRKTMRNR